ncbi:SGNH/GDSL hydrolase family protein [Arachidicoccus ginsenosidivorans]|jgi:lysophospholipase L1-like esterase|nr:SGNH/GDSL hydrolase family protein [Arachidicoccus ginsenosidivorans]
MVTFNTKNALKKKNNRKLILMLVLVLSQVIIICTNTQSLYAQVPTQTVETTDSVFVKNAGIGGNNTIDLLKRVQRDCIDYKPDLTILMIGTNDMNSVKYVPLEKYKQNLIRLLDTIKASGSKVLLMNILPFYTPYLLTRHPKAFYGEAGPEGRQEAVNKAISQIAKQEKVPLLDMHHYFASVGKIGLDKYSLISNEKNTGKTDGIHPTVDGYRLMAALVYQRIIMANLPHKRVVCFGDSITKGDGSITRNSYPAFLKKLLAGK